MPMWFRKKMEEVPLPEYAVSSTDQLGDMKK